MKHLLADIEDHNWQAWPDATISLKRIERMVVEYDLNDKLPMDRPGGALWPMIAWCQENTKGRWTYSWNDGDDCYHWYFRTPGEATRFKLTWA